MFSMIFELKNRAGTAGPKKVLAFCGGLAYHATAKIMRNVVGKNILTVTY
jgi:hypothetical protein